MLTPPTLNRETTKSGIGQNTMDDPSAFRTRFLQSPGRFAQRHERRLLRHLALALSSMIALAAGLVHGWGSSVGLIMMSIGRALAGLMLLGIAGLIVGVILTLAAVFAYNGILNRQLSLIDVEFIDEVPLIFMTLGGLAGVFWALRWPVILGLAGWGLLAMVGVEAILRPAHDRDTYAA
mgnify:CR=1 FL=1